MWVLGGLDNAKNRRHVPEHEHIRVPGDVFSDVKRHCGGHGGRSTTGNAEVKHRVLRKHGGDGVLRRRVPKHMPVRWLFNNAVSRQQLLGTLTVGVKKVLIRVNSRLRARRRKAPTTCRGGLGWGSSW